MEIKPALQLWFAEGFGSGRIPFAPGTWGSVVGVGWFLLLLASGNIWVLLAGCVAGFFLSAWLCGAAEKILGKTDPGSVVIDEITAIPVCFLGWAAFTLQQTGSLPDAAHMIQNQWPLLMAVFALFRLFDVAKPWPVRQSQGLPGGWGVTVDDYLAALYVNLALALIHFGKDWFLS